MTNMKAVELWFLAGQLLHSAPFGEDRSSACNRQNQSDGSIRVVTGLHGTEIKWQCDSPCLASLFAVAELLDDWRAPFVLRYDISG